jgi:hypothetical protein
MGNWCGSECLRISDIKTYQDTLIIPKPGKGGSADRRALAGKHRTAPGNGPVQSAGEPEGLWAKPSVWPDREGRCERAAKTDLEHPMLCKQ